MSFCIFLANVTIKKDEIKVEVCDLHERKKEMKFFEDLDRKLEQIKTDAFYRPYIEELKEAYEKDKNADTILDYASFMCYYTTGSRMEYQSKYFARRRKLGQALMLSLLYEEEEYLNALCESIWEICNEITWVLPAHLADVKVEDYRTHIALFAAETAHSLAEADYLMGDRLPIRIRELIRHEVTTRTFDAYESRPYFWEKLVSNWPGVCAGSIGMAYLYLAPERFEGVKDRLLEVMEHFLRSYGDDGSNTEGISYWQYGFWMYLNFADMLYRHSEGVIDLRHGEKVDKIAKFLQRIVMRKNITISFSDGSRSYAFQHIGLLGYLTKNYEGVVIGATVPGKIGIAECAKPTWIVRDFLWAEPDCFSPSNELQIGMEYMEDAKWYMVKNKKYTFAAKGGHNNEGHNHNDVGNFILATDEGQMIADLGAMEYTAACFNGHTRYTLLQNSSLGHSVPIIDGMAQRSGEKYHAEVKTVTDTEFVMELQDAYETDIEKITRAFEMQESGVVMTDTYTLNEFADHRITERFISLLAPEVNEGYVRIGNVALYAKGQPMITKEVLRNHQCAEEDVWLIDYKVTGNRFVMKIEVEE